jgi:hypothetical protein
VDKIPKARREAHKVLSDLLLEHSSQGLPMLGERSASFCSEIMAKAFKGQDATQSLQLLTLLRSILPTLPSASSLKLIESLLNFISSDNILLVLGSYRTLHSYISDPRTNMEASDISTFINVLKENAPDPTSPDASTEYVLLLAAIIQKLKKVDQDMLAEVLPAGIYSLCGYYASDDRNLTKVRYYFPHHLWYYLYASHEGTVAYYILLDFLLIGYSKKCEGSHPQLCRRFLH